MEFFRAHPTDDFGAKLQRKFQMKWNNNDIWNEKIVIKLWHLKSNVKNQKKKIQTKLIVWL